MNGTASVPKLSIAGVGGVNSNVVVSAIGNGVYVTGRVSWTTGGSGSTAASITGLPFACTYATGGALTGKSIGNSGAANGNSWRIESGSTTINLYRNNESGGENRLEQSKLGNAGHVDLNLFYYSSAV